MAKKYLDKDYNEVEGLVASTGAPDSGKIPALDGSGKIDASMMPVGFTAIATAAIAGEDMSAGMFVNLYNVAGVLKCRKASNLDNTKPADGFVTAGLTAGDTATVYLPGNVNSMLSGLTPAAFYILGTNGGLVLASAEPVATGNIIQAVGKALSASALYFTSNGFRKLA